MRANTPKGVFVFSAALWYNMGNAATQQTFAYNMIEVLKNYFIPHKGNDHRPHILRPKAVLFVCVIAIIAESAFLAGSSFIIPRSQLFGLIVVPTLIDGTNAARTADGLAALRENGLLDAAAQEKANDMVKNDYFAHTSPAGLSPWYWFENVGYNFTSAGENLAVNFADSSDVTAAWLNSPEHRANILNSAYTEIGMATAQGTYNGEPAVYVVELFGAPAAAVAPSLSPVATAQAAAPPVAAATAKPVVKTPPVIVPTNDSAAVAIQGAATQTAPATTPVVPAPVSASASAVLSASTVSAPQANIVQQAVADPRETVDYFYLAIAIIFAAALLLDIFVKIRIQHPQVIMGGMLVILIAGLFIVLNQHFGGAGVVVL